MIFHHFSIFYDVIDILDESCINGIIDAYLLLGTFHNPVQIYHAKSTTFFKSSNTSDATRHIISYAGV